MGGRRVGTLTLGIVLIALGVIYMLVNIFDLNLAVDILKWWPIVLILLGGEVLLYGKDSCTENPSIRFDGISIFTIIVVLFISFGSFIFTKVVNEALNPKSPIYYKHHVSTNFYSPKEIDVLQITS